MSIFKEYFWRQNIHSGCNDLPAALYNQGWRQGWPRRRGNILRQGGSFLCAALSFPIQ